MITGNLLEYLQAFLSPAGQTNFVQVQAEYRPDNIVNVIKYQYLQERGVVFVGRYQGDITKMKIPPPDMFSSLDLRGQIPAGVQTAASWQLRFLAEVQLQN